MAPSRPPPSSSFWGEARVYLRSAASGLVEGRLRSKVDSSDLVQLALLKANANWHQLRAQSDREMLAWLKRILENAAGEVWRYQSRDRRDVQAERSLGNEDSIAEEKRLCRMHDTPSRVIISREQAAQLCDQIDCLPEDQRRAVVMRHLHGATIAEIASSMQRTEAAVGGLLRRGMGRLRESMCNQVTD